MSVIVQTEAGVTTHTQSYQTSAMKNHNDQPAGPNDNDQQAGSLETPLALPIPSTYYRAL
jgi:hypothetical protein